MFKEIFGRKKKTPVARREPHTHDFTKRYWGHNIEFIEKYKDDSYNVVTWSTPIVRKGDTIIVKGRDNSTIVFDVVEAIWYYQVDDMAKAVIKRKAIHYDPDSYNLELR